MDWILSIVFVALAAALFLTIKAQSGRRSASVELATGNGKAVVDVELADTFLKKMKGLMFRKSLGPKEGMIFVFDDEAGRSFWMMNTYIPLDAVFFDSYGVCVDVISMEASKGPFSFKTYRSAARSMFVLEVNAGFAKEHGIEIGKTRISF